MATKVGTAYVDVVANFKPLNQDMRQLNAVSARLSANMRRSMSVVSRDATRASRSVGRLTNQVAGVGVAARVSGNQATAGMRQFEAACQRSLRTVRRLEAAQRSLASVRPSAAAAMPRAVDPWSATGPGAAPVPGFEGPMRGLRRAGARPYPSSSRGAAGFDPIGMGVDIGVGAMADGVVAPLARAYKAHYLGTIGSEVTQILAGAERSSKLSLARTTLGSMSQAGKFAPRVLMGGFGRAVPAAGAIYGVGRSLQAGLEGDLGSAGIRAGGAAAGAVAGGIAGTLIPIPGMTVLGALAGAGIGEGLAELGESIFGGGESGNDKAARLGAEFSERWSPSLEKAARNKNLSKLKKRRAILRSNLVEAKDSGADDEALAPLRKATRATEGTIKQIEVPRKTVDKNMKLMKSGVIARMQDIRRVFSTNMMGINQGWNRGTKQWRNATAQNMHGTVRAIQSGMKKGLISTKTGHKEIAALHKRIKFVTGEDPYKIAAGFKSSWKKAGTVNNKQIAGMIRDMKAMPKGAREQTQAAAIEMARGLEKNNKLSKGSTARLQSALVTTFGNTSRKVTKAAANINTKAGGSFRNLAGGVKGAMGNVKTNVNSALSAFKVGIVQFPLQEVAGPPAPKQRGGFIVPGHGEGDSFSTSLDSGSFVLNKRATKAFGFQGGGRVPVLLEPGERVFGPHEVRRHGLGTLHALNDSVPRFQVGGRVPDQRLGGPAPLSTMGQHAINRADRAAEKWVAKHSLPRRVARMLKFANRESAKGYDYVYGGGHGQLGVGPYDCSGFVSAILGAGDFVGAPMAVAQGSGLYVLGEAGAGKYFTWGVRGSSGENAHTMMAIKGPKGRWNYFEAGGGGGAGRRSGWNGAFSYRHIPGFQRGGQVGSMPRRAQEAIARFGAAAQDPSSPHFVGWGYNGGGSVLKLAGGGNINHTWSGATLQTEKDAWYALPELPGYILAALAEAAGKYVGSDMPGWTMYQVTKGEGSAKPGSMGDDDGDGSPDGYGWLAITRPHGASFGVGRMGGYEEMLNPVKNAYVAARMYGARGLAPWYGKQHVTDPNKHYTGKHDITKSLGGMSFGEALGNPIGSSEGPGSKEATTISGTRKANVTVGIDERSWAKKYKEQDYAKSGKRRKKRRYNVTTAPLQFGPVPKDLLECTNELRKRQMELGDYRDAVKDSDDPDEKKALQENLKKLRERIDDLKRARFSLIAQQRIGRLKKKALYKALFEPWTKPKGIFETREREYQTAQEKADQIVDQEPEAEEMTPQWVASTLAPYVNVTESGAFSQVLLTQQGWRNALLGAFDEADRRKAKWDAEATRLKERIAEIQAYKDDPEAIEKWKNQRQWIPALRDEIEFFRGQKKEVNGILPEWRDSLEGLQGMGRTWKRVDLAAVDVAEFGGTIYETRKTMEGLGLKVKDAEKSANSETTQVKEEELAHEKEMRRQEGQRLAVSQAQFQVLRDFNASYPVGQFPPYAGKAHSGAIVPGRPGEEKTMIVQGQERIRTPEQELRLAEGIKGTTGGEGAVPQFIVNGDIVQGAGETRDPVEMVLGDRRFPIAVRRVAMGGRATPGGARG